MATKTKINKNIKIPKPVEISEEINPEKNLKQKKKQKKQLKEKTQDTPNVEQELQKPVEKEETSEAVEDPKKTNALAWGAGIAGGAVLLFILFTLFKKRNGDVLSGSGTGTETPKKPTPPKENKPTPPKTVPPVKVVPPTQNTPKPQDPIHKRLSEFIPLDPFWFKKDGVMLPLTTYGNVAFLGRKQYNIDQGRQKLEADLQFLRSVIPLKNFMVAIQFYILKNARAGAVNQLRESLTSTNSVHSNLHLFWDANSDRKAGDPPKWKSLSPAERTWFESYNIPYQDE